MHGQVPWLDELINPYGVAKDDCDRVKSAHICREGGERSRRPVLLFILGGGITQCLRTDGVSRDRLAGNKKQVVFLSRPPATTGCSEQTLREGAGENRTSTLEWTDHNEIELQFWNSHRYRLFLAQRLNIGKFHWAGNLHSSLLQILLTFDYIQGMCKRDRRGERLH